MRSSLMTGYSFRTSAAASRPSCTSCSGVYLFFGGVMRVCASGAVTSIADSADPVTTCPRVR